MKKMLNIRNKLATIFKIIELSLMIACSAIFCDLVKEDDYVKRVIEVRGPINIFAPSSPVKAMVVYSGLVSFCFLTAMLFICSIIGKTFDFFGNTIICFMMSLVTFVAAAFIFEEVKQQEGDSYTSMRIAASLALCACAVLVAEAIYTLIINRKKPSSTVEIK